MYYLIKNTIKNLLFIKFFIQTVQKPHVNTWGFIIFNLLCDSILRHIIIFTL